MNQVPTYSYDEEADVLYISFSHGEKTVATVELNDNILLRFNRAEKRAVGLTLLDFSILAQTTELYGSHTKIRIPFRFELPFYLAKA